MRHEQILGGLYGHKRIYHNLPVFWDILGWLKISPDAWFPRKLMDTHEIWVTAICSFFPLKVDNYTRTPEKKHDQNRRQNLVGGFNPFETD